MAAEIVWNYLGGAVSQNVIGTHPLASNNQFLPDSLDSQDWGFISAGLETISISEVRSVYTFYPQTHIAG